MIEFSGERLSGAVVDGSQNILDALDEAKLEADDETRLKTLEEILCEARRRAKPDLGGKR